MKATQLIERAKAGQGHKATARAVKHLLGVIHELNEHLDYIGWGDAYEREPVVAAGGLRDQTAELLKGFEPTPEADE